MIYGYLAKYPDVSIELELCEPSVDLAREGFDIAVFTGKVESTDFVARELWAATRKLLFASPRYIAARGMPRTLDELARHDCIATHATDGVATWTFVRGGKKRKLMLAPRFYVNEFSAAHRAVLAGLGIARLPEVLCAEDVAEKRLVRVLDGWEGDPGGVSLLYRNHRALTAAVRVCIAHFLAELPSSESREQAPLARWPADGSTRAAPVAQLPRVCRDRSYAGVSRNSATSWRLPSREACTRPISGSARKAEAASGASHKP